PRRVRMPGEGVDVELGAGAPVLPALAAVAAPHQAAELDPDEHDLRLVRTRRDPANMGRPRPRREAPGRRGGERAQPLERPPAAAAVVAPEEHARLAAGVDGAVRRADGDGEDVRLRQVEIVPGAAAVFAPPDPLPPRAGVERPVAGGDALRAAR